MVESLARQAVILKTLDTNSILLGNYECAYAIGLFDQINGKEENDDFDDMTAWFESAMESIKAGSYEDERLVELRRMMELYKPSPKLDEQMKNIYHTGYQEKNMWVVNP